MKRNGGARAYQQRRVWEFVRKQCKQGLPARRRDICAALKMSTNAVSNLLYRLTQSKCLVRTGESWRATYAPGTNVPEDARGYRRSSLQNLHKHNARGGWHEALCKAQRVRGRTTMPRRVRVPDPVHALERAMGWM